MVSASPERHQGSGLLDRDGRAPVLGSRQLHLRLALQEANLPFDTAAESSDHADARLAQIPASEYRHLTELTTLHRRQSGYDYSDEYDFGLDLILDCLERARDMAPSPAS